MHMTVISSDNALYAALKFLPEGSRMTLFTRDSGAARTAIVAELRKEAGNGWHDWEILRRPATADASLLPATWSSEIPEATSTKSLADAMTANSDLWAEVHD